MSTTNVPPLLQVEQLRTHFDTLEGVVRAVDGVSFTLEAGQTLGIVGESGCGKSVTAMSILRLLPNPPSRHAGAIRYRGQDLLALSEREMRAIRGNRISMIFQEPMSSLNPVLSVGRQIAESLRKHQGLGRVSAMAKATELLRLVQIPQAQRRTHEYPHQLSGGMRQRVMIALALACRPELLIADEPTTALDVTIQAQILDLIAHLQQELGMSMILITHDLGVVAEICDRVIVMYAGKIVEEADVLDLFDRPLHPYTRALMASMPSLNTQAARLTEIPGIVPALNQLGSGCSFAARCSLASGVCRLHAPHLVECGVGHSAACHWVAQGGLSGALPAGAPS